jgi:hypothetical protein
LILPLLPAQCTPAWHFHQTASISLAAPSPWLRRPSRTKPWVGYGFGSPANRDGIDLSQKKEMSSGI